MKTKRRVGLLPGLRKARFEASNHSANHKRNARRLAKFPGQEQEARAREMAAVYLDEFVWCINQDIKDIERERRSDAEKEA